MKAFDESRRALTQRAGLILLFDGEVGPATRDRDEHYQADILTSGMDPSLPPSRLVWNQWLDSRTHAREWKLVARYSGATVPDFHGVP